MQLPVAWGSAGQSSCQSRRLAALVALAALGLFAVGAVGTLAGCGSRKPAATSGRDGPPSPCVIGTPALRGPNGKPQPDLSGCKRVGQASFYARSFAGRPMADGAIMNPRGSNAASRTLPIGTAAKVTNLETGQSAVVIIEDRGPYEKGRLLDLSPSTAHRIGISTHEGVAPVAVAPIAVPLPDGRVKLGVAAQEAAATAATPAPDAPADPRAARRTSKAAGDRS